MDFRFSEEQQMFSTSLSELLAAEVSAERIRLLWDTSTGRSDELWKQFADLGLFSMLVPEESDGLGLSEVDFVLLAEQCGLAALPEPLVDTVLVTVPILVYMGADALLQEVIHGTTRVATGNLVDPWLADAHIASHWLLPDPAGTEIHMVKADSKVLNRQLSMNPSRRIYTQTAELNAETCWMVGETVRHQWQLAFERGALGSAAQQLGLAQRMLDMATEYCSERKQFGVPIGSFQAVKHQLADVSVALDFARPVVYRAAWALAEHNTAAQNEVSQAFIAASKASQLAARNCMQVHGAMGYTWELDLQIWMKKAWVLNKLWGGQSFHRQRLSTFLADSRNDLGAGYTFSSQSGGE